ncbi:hypothetical protein ACLOJK_041426, partial [Asimina triloba]
DRTGDEAQPHVGAPGGDKRPQVAALVQATNLQEAQATDNVIAEMEGLDVILGTNWLVKYGANMNFETKQ